ncbi:Transposon Ty3-I Gag-Pol polyprotein [Podosphaera aphanis]|nr:Transposon Ty3-I Gag-Pol polyprotein [Podosphaera aphanis]
MITDFVKVSLNIGNHPEIADLFVTRLGHYPIILGHGWLSCHNPNVDWYSNSVNFNSSFCATICNKTSVASRKFPFKLLKVKGLDSANLPEYLPNHPKAVSLDIKLMKEAPFNLLASQDSNEIFALSIFALNQALATETEELKVKLPPWLYHQASAFSKLDSRVLPPHRPIDHKIVLKEGSQPPFGKLYGMTREELLALQEWLNDDLSKGFVRASSSPAASPVLFVKKSDGSLRLYRLSKAKYFTKLDVISAFNRIRIAKGDEWKTAFRTRYGLFESLVMPFGLTNAPSTFQNHINNTLQEFLDVFCTAYLDDVLVYSNNLEDHRRHVNLVLDKLKNAGLQLDIKKCQFEATEVKYLGLIISRRGIEMDPVKIECVKSCGKPSCVKDIQAFLGFANFYRRFIKGFSQVARPLTELTRKNITWSWSSNCDQAFNALKSAFVRAPILRHFDPDRRCIVEVDSSDWAHGGILSQFDDEGTLHPVAYFSGKLNPAQINYEIYDKELLAVVTAFEHWRPELQGTLEPISVVSDHKNLEYFMSTKTLNRRQARWSEFLPRFNFVITYRPGKLGRKPDALTRRSEDLPKNKEDHRLRQQSQTILKPHNIDPKLALIKEVPPIHLAPTTIEASVHSPSSSELIESLLRKGYREDKALQCHIKTLQGPGPHQSKLLDLSRCSLKDGRLYFDNMIYIPDISELKLHLIKSCHDHPSGGHHGRNKVFSLVSRYYWWPNMLQLISQYTNNCYTCKRINPSRLKYQGLLKQLPVPERRWRDVSVDFIGPLPELDGFDCIMVVGYRLTKARHFIPCETTIDAIGTAKLFYKHIWKHHGFPESVISDRGPQFLAKFCVETDGQTERFNAILECYLRAYFNYQQDDWADWLPSAEYNANDTESATTKVIPFFANSAQHPRSEITPPRDQNPPSTSDYLRIQQNLANDFINQMNDLNTFLRENMTASQAFYEKYANQHRSNPPYYQVGDKVLVNAKNIRTKRPSKKLDWKNLGPFQIVKVISSHSYQLSLPEDLKSVHPAKPTNQTPQ